MCVLNKNYLGKGHSKEFTKVKSNIFASIPSPTLLRVFLWSAGGSLLISRMKEEGTRV
jgi:hypothetical protein